MIICCSGESSKLMVCDGGIPVETELWQKEKNSLSAVFKKKIMGDEKELTYETLMQKDLPDFLRLHLKNQARKILQQEKPMTWSESNRYALKDPQVMESYDRLMGLLLIKTKFTREELQRWIDLGVKFQIDVLVQPRKALENLFYKRDTSRNKNDIVQVLAQLAEGRPFMLCLSDLVKNAEEKKIDVSSFSYLAKKAEEETFVSKPLEAFLLDVRKIEKFFKITGRVNGDFLTTNVIVALLKERSLDDIADGIKEVADSRNENHWTYEDIETALERQLVLRGLSESDNGNSSHDNSNGKKEPKDQKNKSVNISNEILEEAILEARNEPVTNEFFESLFQVPAAETTVVVEEKAVKTTPPRITFGGVDEDDSSFFVTRRNIEKQPPGPYPSLRSLISHKERKIFIKKLFDKDKGVYHAFIDRLEETDKWKEAKLIIDDELSKRQLSPFCREAVRLGDIVFSRYFSHKP